ncbi:hypothetical protein C1I58_19685 [Bacillus sp. PIC28]|uniref:Uncharacterized protein n=1 Tax=Bacillus thuringiensis TaxID=1428 RepID=A0A9X7C1L8_BACTU|nr:hypothetical protein BHL54_14295 [Bacillus cereus]PFT80751.1 hypothetical protein COK81_26650 [Bacillus thuringiensis]PGH85973.1 hypothetical protein CN899_07240 [Bacillus thuringiensis]PGP40881.1 hypothetical protein CN993_24320 [Bacillus thuringiensis]TKV45571.1 hypothetical protein C1I58_19685 [Bacillus sp. PIC28]
MQMNEKIKDHRFILCFIGCSFVIKIFLLNCNRKYRKNIVVINWNEFLNKISLLFKEKQATTLQ